MNNSIIALCIAKNSSSTIQKMIESISWTDILVIVNDKSSDDTVDKIKSSKHTIDLQENMSGKPLLDYKIDGTRDVANELNIRNYWVNYCFDTYNPKCLILIDSDELMSSELLDIINRVDTNTYNSIALQCNHLVSKNLILDVLKQNWNGLELIDPHVRVLFRNRKYIKGEWTDYPDPFLKHDMKTLCINNPIHFHLHYLPQFKRKNYSFNFLPDYLSLENCEKYIKKIENIPEDITRIIDNI